MTCSQAFCYTPTPLQLLVCTVAAVPPGMVQTAGTTKATLLQQSLAAGAADL